MGDNRDRRRASEPGPKKSTFTPSSASHASTAAWRRNSSTLDNLISSPLRAAGRTGLVATTTSARRRDESLEDRPRQGDEQGTICDTRPLIREELGQGRRRCVNWLRVSWRTGYLPTTIREAYHACSRRAPASNRSSAADRVRPAVWAVGQCGHCRHRRGLRAPPVLPAIGSPRAVRTASAFPIAGFEMGATAINRRRLIQDDARAAATATPIR